MTLKTVLYPTQVHSTGGWKNIVTKHRVLHVVFVSLLAALAVPNAAWGQVEAAPPISGVIGKVQAFTGSSLDVATPAGVVHVDVKQPLTTYKEKPSELSRVTSASYVGVASTEQADGKEVAKKIIIFPAE